MSHRANKTKETQFDELSQEQAEAWGERLTDIFLMEVDESDIRHEFKEGLCPRCGHPLKLHLFFDAKRIEYHFPCLGCQRVDTAVIEMPSARCTITRSQPLRLDYASLSRGA